MSSKQELYLNYDISCCASLNNKTNTIYSCRKVK